MLADGRRVEELQYFGYSRYMESSDAVELLHALAHPGRLAVFKLLVQAGPQGLPAGQVAGAFGTPANSMSAQLAILSRAKLISSERQGRSIIYAARYDRMTALLTFLLEDCCAGSPRICEPLADLVTGASVGARRTPDPHQETTS